MLAREAKEYAAALVYFSCWSSAVAVEWAEYNIVGIYLRLNV
jgi:hypothetical protein